MSDHREIVAGDIGGTNARFCLAVLAGSEVVSLGETIKIRTHEYASFADAWRVLENRLRRPLPREAVIAVACPAHGDVLKLTNSPWTLHPAALKHQLRLDMLRFVNDFGAIGHALAQLQSTDYLHLSGPAQELPARGMISVVGPGTGLGVAQVLRQNDTAQVVETEGGHISFAPQDEFEDALLARLRARYEHVSVERIVSGPGLLHIYNMLAGREGRVQDDAKLWQAGICGTDELAALAVRRFCQMLGTVAGDYALAHGARAVVIAGGIAPRLATLLPQTDFAQRFIAKGRFQILLAGLPVKLIVHPEPGLLGAAAAAVSTTSCSKRRDLLQ